MFVFHFLIESLIESLAGLAVTVALPLLNLAGWASGQGSTNKLLLLSLFVYLKVSTKVRKFLLSKFVTK